MALSETLIFGKYKLLEPLGRGGMAEVYKALSVGAAGFQRPVVIKRILPNLSSNRQFVDMFIKEASIAASLDHPNIVQVFDLGEDEGDLFMVLEYVPGLDLGTGIQHFTEKGRTFPHQLVAFISVDMCKALECAHGYHDPKGQLMSVIHRDVSPQNVLLSMAGTVKLADFGLAMALTDARVTLPGIIKGKLGYLSPEQAAGARELDIRSDLFSLGVVMFEAITGKRLFAGMSPADTIRRINKAEVPSLSETAPKVPGVLVDLVHSLLARDREDRPGTAKDVRKVLARYLRRVHPPVDANTLAGVVRHIVREREEAKSDLLVGDDDIQTQAYQSSYEEMNDDDQGTKTQPDIPLESRKAMKDESKSSMESEDVPTAVIISRVVNIDGSDDEGTSGLR